MGRLANSWTVYGRLGGDPELRFFDNGGAVTNFSVATTLYRKKKDDGSYEDVTEWVRCSAFQQAEGNRKIAETITSHFKKGNRILVSGYSKTRDYEKDGQKHYITELIVQDFEFVETKAEGAGGGGGGVPPVTSDEEVPF